MSSPGDTRAAAADTNLTATVGAAPRGTFQDVADYYRRLRPGD
jgi:hypothetical protein